jgi:hypothetical protein
MTDHRKRPRDPAQLAKFIVDVATGEIEDEPAKVEGAATEFARKGGLKGGKARAAKLAPERRAEIAKQAAKARWGSRQKGVKIK